MFFSRGTYQRINVIYTKWETADIFNFAHLETLQDWTNEQKAVLLLSPWNAQQVVHGSFGWLHLWQIENNNGLIVTDCSL